MNYWFHKGDRVRLTKQASEEASVDESRVWEVVSISQEEGAKDNADLAYKCRSGTWEAWWLDRELVRAGCPSCRIGQNNPDYCTC